MIVTRLYCSKTHQIYSVGLNVLVHYVTRATYLLNTEKDHFFPPKRGFKYRKGLYEADQF